jgi:hypothetical protein
MSYTFRSSTIRPSSLTPYRTTSQPAPHRGRDDAASFGVASRVFGLALAWLALACGQGDGDAGSGTADDGSADDGFADDGSADDGFADDGFADDGFADDGFADGVDEADVEDPAENGVAAIELVIDGRQTLPGQARFTIWEDIDSVELSITGAGGAADFLQIDLILPVFYELVGDHHSDLGVPLTVGNVVNASLSGEDLFSRQGEVDLSVSGEGHIEGTFAVSMASAEGIDSDDSAFQGAAEVAALSGRFSGGWVMTCFSRLPGHMTWVRGGEFCQSLQLQ